MLASCVARSLLAALLLGLAGCAGYRGGWESLIEFDTPSSSPETPDITPDLSRALAAPGVSAVPPIRFLSVRWREGYT